MNITLNIVWQLAAKIAVEKKQKEIEPVHFLWGIVFIMKFENDLREFFTDDSTARQISHEVNECKQYINSKGYSLNEIYNKTIKIMPEGSCQQYEDGLLHRSAKLKALFNETALQHPEIKLPDLLRIILENIPEVIPDHLQEKPNIASQKNEVPKPKILDKYGKELISMAKKNELAEIYGRSEEIKKLGRILLQKNKKNAILIGEAGVGKTAIVEGLAIAIAKGKVPLQMQSMKIYELSVTSLVAGTKYRGEFEERMNSIIEEASNPDVILFFDEIHNLLGAGQSGETGDVSNILKPALGKGTITVIGATTTKEYRKYFEKDNAFDRRFQKIHVNEPDTEQTILILNSLKSTFEKHYHLTISEEAIIQSVKLAERYLPDFRFPDKAIDIIDNACSMKVFSSALFSEKDAGQNSNLPVVDENDIFKVVSGRTNIPLQEIAKNDFDRIAGLDKYLKDKIIGQDNAIDEIVNAIKIAKAGFRESNKPVAVILLAGPTGVGKTQIAKETARFIFGNERKLIRIDMSEYMEKHEISKLIGAPPGYIGSDEEGILISKVRSNPYSVILFDEIEKAHPDINNIFLQIFDEGELTSSQNKKVSFCNTIIFLTSNLGSKEKPKPVMNPVGFKAGITSEPVNRKIHGLEISNHFSPELLNRISKIVIFNHLDKDSVSAIFHKSLNEFSCLLSEKGFDLIITENAIKNIEKDIYSVDYGVRYMKRIMEKMLYTPIANMMLDRNFTSGTIHIDTNDLEELVFSPLDSN
jgi:ATP-dependent Clp protease ATP-binding subunit ClpC